jgi:hypothetical protein
LGKTSSKRALFLVTLLSAAFAEAQVEAFEKHPESAKHSAIPVVGYSSRHDASEGPQLAERVAVDVRVISASDLVVDGASHSSPPFAIDSRIRQLTSKLQQLHYRTFRLQYEERVILSLLKREKVVLRDGHELTLRPTYLEGNRVGLWFRWTDGTGSDLLNTRVHLSCGESIVAGTDDEESGKGVLIALTAHPAR